MTQHSFKVGDRVKVISAPETHDRAARAQVGKLGTVSSVASGGEIGVAIPGDETYWYWSANLMIAPPPIEERTECEACDACGAKSDALVGYNGRHICSHCYKDRDAAEVARDVKARRAPAPDRTQAPEPLPEDLPPGTIVRNTHSNKREPAVYFCGLRIDGSYECRTAAGHFWIHPSDVDWPSYYAAIEQQKPAEPTNYSDKQVREALDAYHGSDPYTNRYPGNDDANVAAWQTARDAEARAELSPLEQRRARHREQLLRALDRPNAALRTFPAAWSSATWESE